MNNLNTIKHINKKIKIKYFKKKKNCSVTKYPQTPPHHSNIIL